MEVLRKMHLVAWEEILRVIHVSCWNHSPTIKDKIWHDNMNSVNWTEKYAGLESQCPRCHVEHESSKRENLRSLCTVSIGLV